jgi:hypothetical protein
VATWRTGRWIDVASAGVVAAIALWLYISIASIAGMDECLDRGWMYSYDHRQCFSETESIRTALLVGWRESAVIGAATLGVGLIVGLVSRKVALIVFRPATA